MLKYLKESEIVLALEGFSFFVRFGDEFATVRNHDIQSVKLLTEAGVALDVIDCESISKMKVGALKTIEEGSLKGLECEVVNVNNKDKIIIRITSIQQNIIATMPSSCLLDLSKT